MSDLHLALLLLAAVLLVLLVGYNKWQERRELAKMEASLRSGVGDALLDEPAPDEPPRVAAGPVQRVEPRFGTLPEPLVVSDGAPPEGDLPPPAAAPPPPDPAAGWIEDPMLDCVLELRCTHAVDGVTVLDAIAGLQRQKFVLPVHVAAWDARGQQWVNPDRFGFYTEMLVAIQMANRRVALDEVEASRFLAAVQQVAVALDADFDTVEVPRIVALAGELRDSSSQFDVQIGLTLEAAGGPWDATRLHAAATKAGLEQIGPSLWRRLDESGAVVFSFGSASLLSDRLSLELDVPLAPAAERPLVAMFDAGQLLAAELGARIVDDNGQAVDAASLARVQERLEELYASMRHAGYEPGSPRAARLYG